MNAQGGSRQRTALHYASVNDHVKVARLLLEAGSDEFCRDVGGYTPLNLAKGGKMCKLLHKVLLAFVLVVSNSGISDWKYVGWARKLF